MDNTSPAVVETPAAVETGKVETPKVETPKPKPTVVPLKGPKALVLSALVAAGLSNVAQANILSQVESESNFQPKSENLNYSSAEKIQKVFEKDLKDLNYK